MTSSSDPILFIQSESDQVLDPVAPIVNDEKLEHNENSTFASLEKTAPHSNEEAPSVNCEPLLSSTSVQIDSRPINLITLSDEIGSNDPISIHVSDLTSSTTAVRTDSTQALAAKFGIYFDK